MSMARYLEPARFKKLALGNWEMPCFSVVPHFFFFWRIVVTSLNLLFASWGLRMQQGWCLYRNWWKQAAKKSFGSVRLHSCGSFWLEFSWRILSDEKKRGPFCCRCPVRPQVQSAGQPDIFATASFPNWISHLTPPFRIGFRKGSQFMS